MKELTNKILIVEGADDEKVIEKLLKRRKIIYDNFSIQSVGGIDKLLKNVEIRIKSENHTAIGIVIDADENILDRWRNIENIFIKSGYENVPPLARSGVVFYDNDVMDLPKIGIWIMPDNNLSGNLEDFIRTLIPESDDLIGIAEETIEDLISHKLNRFSSNKKSKAIIHTWLAWQEQPGMPLGRAITHRLLDKNYLTDTKKANNFINWLQRMFKN